MKKILLPFLLFALVFVGGHTVFAQAADGSVQPGGTCTGDADCYDANGQSYGCNGGICTVNGDAPANGTVQPGGACTNDTSCADVNGQSYGCYSGQCTLNGDTPAGASTPF